MIIKRCLTGVGPSILSKSLVTLTVLTLLLTFTSLPAAGITEEQLKMLDMLEQLDQLDQLDYEEFVSLINQANTCTRSRDFNCTERALTAAKKVVSTSNDKSTLSAAYVALDAERQALALEIEAKRRAIAEQKARMDAEESRRNNRNVTAALLGVVMSGAMIDAGASSSEAFEAGKAMFQDVSNNTTSNMQNLIDQSKNGAALSSGQLGGDQRGLNQPSSGYAFDPQGCAIEQNLCGNDSACVNRVSQSSICNNGNSSHSYQDMLDNIKSNDSRIKQNPNIPNYSEINNNNLQIDKINNYHEYQDVRCKDNKEGCAIQQ